MPRVTRLVDINMPEAERLADLYEIRFDLHTCKLWCAEAAKAGATKSRNYLLEEAIVTAAIVRYARCFAEGVRLSLKAKDLQGLGQPHIKGHAFFIGLRRRFIAHAVNAFEETYVNAEASVIDGIPQPITKLSAGQHRVVLTFRDAAKLSRLATAVLAVVAKQIVVEEKRVMAVIREMPLDAIHSGDLHQPENLWSLDVETPRRRGVHAQKR